MFCFYYFVMQIRAFKSFQKHIRLPLRRFCVLWNKNFSKQTVTTTVYDKIQYGDSGTAKSKIIAKNSKKQVKNHKII